MLSLQKNQMYPPNIDIEDYNYDLPEDRIAKYPLTQRDDSNLLVYQNGQLSTQTFRAIGNYFKQNDFIVFNDTKVIQARLLFRKETGAEIEIFLLEPIEPNDYVRVFQTRGSCKWKCIIGNLKKWKNDTIHMPIENGKVFFELKAEKAGRIGDAFLIEFHWPSAYITFGEILDRVGKTPIPPYLKRLSEAIDKNRYQTIYSQFEGSVAAPTAGLHFTDSVINGLKQKGVNCGKITLHVGAGTFKPVKSSSIIEHEMHTEHFIINKELIERIIAYGGRVTAVGTTTVRTLESIYWLGVKLKNHKTVTEMHIDQWEPYQNREELSVHESLQYVMQYMEERELHKIEASTSIMIVPGYKFKIVKKLVTNFHQPKSTLLLLIAAFIGDDWKEVYRYAMDHAYRFLSYGDSSLLMPA